MGSLSFAAILVLVLVACLSQASSAKAADSPNSPSSSVPGVPAGSVSIDGQLFATEVPSYAVLGKNYTLMVVIQSNVNTNVPIIVQVVTPVSAIFVRPRAVHADVPAEGSAVANFTILPFGSPHSGPFNVTAQVYVFYPLSMTSPVLVDQASGIVSTIGPSPFPYLEVVVVSGVAISMILVVVFYSGSLRKRIAAPPK